MKLLKPVAELVFSSRFRNVLTSSSHETGQRTNFYFPRETASDDDDNVGRTLVKKYEAAFPVTCTCVPSPVLSHLHGVSLHQTTVRCKT